MKWRSVKVLCFFFLLVGVLAVGATDANATTKKFADSKVKKVTVKKATGTYKSWDWDSKKKDYTVQKFKYTKGYNLTWKKIKGATGYKITVYRYSPVREKYVVIKTKNVKKAKYLLTDIVKGETYKYTIQAYKGSGTKRKYSRCSKKFSFKPKLSCNIIKTDKNHNIIYKPEYDRFEAEKAFIIQNQYRKEKGVAELIWSEALYEVCKVRAKQIVDDFSHDALRDTYKSILICKFNMKDRYVTSMENAYGSITNYYIDLGNDCGENITYGGNAKSAINNWKESKRHYDNMTSSLYMSCALACYDGRWVSIFSTCDIDQLAKGNLDSLSK